MLTLSPTTRNFGALTVKVFFDRVAALFLLLILSPLLIIIYFAVKLTSKGPAIYKQQRCGINGKKFTFYKFRSMYNNAADIKSTLQNNNEMKGWAFKIKNDPRITSVGKFIRRFSFDELPQLWNVLKGDMSLVGPRPALPEEVKKFKLWERRRLSMKPGMTGLWQVSGRTKLPNDQWVVYDLDYIDNWSLTNDIKIISKTLLVIVRGDGM
jgi:exopolysaccharide biosynthesis polyprenyl glycosylphosphotransferase